MLHFEFMVSIEFSLFESCSLEVRLLKLERFSAGLLKCVSHKNEEGLASPSRIFTSLESEVKRNFCLRTWLLKAKFASFAQKLLLCSWR